MENKNKKAELKGKKARQAGTKGIGSGRGRISEINTFRMYLRDIDRIPLMNREEEEKTANLAAQGNTAARERLVNANLRFVVTVAKKYQGRGMPLLDLINEGNIGLINATKNFNTEKGFRFITYAVWWIRQSIVKAINEKGRMIRLPNNKSTDVTRIERTINEAQKHAVLRHDEEVLETAVQLDMSPEKVMDLISISQDVLSLDDPTERYDDTFTVKDQLADVHCEAPDEDATVSVLKDDLNLALEGLEERTARIIRSRFGLENMTPMTLQEVGDLYNISRERVRQIEKKALLQLKLSQRSRKLQGYIAS